MKIKIFDAEEITTENGKITTNDILPHMMKLTKNPFPYDFREDIKHYVFWSTRSVDLTKSEVPLIWTKIAHGLSLAAPNNSYRENNMHPIAKKKTARTVTRTDKNQQKLDLT